MALVGVVAALVVLTVGRPLGAQAANLNVAAGEVAVAANGQCSLIEAIVNANANAATHADCPAGSGADTIALVASTYTLTTVENTSVCTLGSNGLPVITSDITINGNGATVERSAAAPEFRIFCVSSTGKLTLNNDVTVSGGFVRFGGGIQNQGMLTLTNSTVSGNSVILNGGGIFNALGGTLTLTNSTVSDNTTTTSGGNGGGIHNFGTAILNSSAVSGNVSFSAGGGIVNAGTLTLTSSTVSGNSTTFSSGGGIFSFGTATLNSSTVSGNSASANGGGIDNSGTLILNSSTVTDNSTTFSEGGGIFTGFGANATLTNSTVSHNTTIFSSGGGIFNAFGGTLTLTNSTVSGNNQAATDGGGIANVGTLTLTSSTVSGNTADANGGGIFNFGMLTLNSTTVSGNAAFRGGGIYNDGGGMLTLNSSTVSDNTVAVQESGGGIYNNFGATTTLNSSTISGNTAGGGGGIYNPGGDVTLTDSTVGSNTTSFFGGGIWNDGGLATLTLTDSTISDNAARLRGGGIYNLAGTLTITSSTIERNSAGTTTPDGGGGGIYNHLNGAPFTATNSTISGNTAHSGGGGGVLNVDAVTSLISTTVSENEVKFGGVGPGLRNFSSTLTIRNTIVANSIAGDDCAGVITVEGNNFVESPVACVIVGSGTVNSGFDPLLGPLALNAPGTTETHALLSGSPAIDGSPDCPPPATDQRGVLRPQDGDNNGSLICDIGAFEREAGLHDVEAVHIAGTGGPNLNLFLSCGNSDPCTVTQNHQLLVRNNSDHIENIGVDYKVVWPQPLTDAGCTVNGQSGSPITVNNTVEAGVIAVRNVGVALTFSCPASAESVPDVVGAAITFRLEAVHRTSGFNSQPDDDPSNDIVTRGKIIK